jgi:hypothetical protein
VAATISGSVWSSHPKFATFCNAEYVVSAFAVQVQLAKQTTTPKPAMIFFMRAVIVGFRKVEVKQGGIRDGKLPQNPAPMAETGATRGAAR